MASRRPLSFAPDFVNKNFYVRTVLRRSSCLTTVPHSFRLQGHVRCIMRCPQIDLRRPAMGAWYKCSKCRGFKFFRGPMIKRAISPGNLDWDLTSTVSRYMVLDHPVLKAVADPIRACREHWRIAMKYARDIFAACTLVVVLASSVGLLSPIAQRAGYLTESAENNAAAVAIVVQFIGIAGMVFFYRRY